MAVLKIVGRFGQVLRECEVQGATTMGYAIFHIADMLGMDPESGAFYLSEYPGMITFTTGTSAT